MVTSGTSIGDSSSSTGTHLMNRLLRTGIAGFAAWKLGGGLLGAIVIFLIVFYLLGMF